MPDGQLEEGFLLNDRYRVLRVIGQGGMGTVYQAEHERLKAIVAVKEIRGTPATGTAEQPTMEQYEHEARFLVRLNHPNLPKVTDAFVDGDRFYLVMDFVEGATLENCLRMRGGSPLEPATVVSVAIEIADVLRYLHSQNPPIIFRDLKPTNVMVQPDRHIKLIDFGIARRFQPGASKDTSLLGSVGYSPPEQFGRHQTDKRSDIYALGATMHHLLTARDPSISPFKFVPVDQVVPGIPNSLSRLIANCVALDPDMRPPDAEVVSAELFAIRDILNNVGAPAVQARAEADAAVANRMATIGTIGNSWMPGAHRVVSGNMSSGRMNLPVFGRLRYAFVAIGIAAFAAIAISVDNGSRHLKTKKHPTRNIQSHSASSSNHRFRSRAATTLGGASESNTGGSNPGDSVDLAAGETNQQSGDSESSGSSRGAQCSAEVLGPSPDGKSLRLHISGEINGKKDAAGRIAAYFYKSDRTPLRSKDPNGAYATSTGQLFAEITFQIDEDSKSIDGLIDVPVDQFSSTNNLLLKCIIYADKQSAGQTEYMPFSVDTTTASNSSES